jgi:hypothetical protein
VTTISADTIVKQKPDLLANELNESETVILDVEGGVYYGLRGVGKAIWDQIYAPVSVEALCERLSTQFDVDLETCRRETTAFLETLQDRGLIEATR